MRRQIAGPGRLPEARTQKDPVAPASNHGVLETENLRTEVSGINDISPGAVASSGATLSEGAPA